MLLVVKTKNKHSCEQSLTHNASAPHCSLSCLYSQLADVLPTPGNTLLSKKQNVASASDCRTSPAAVEENRRHPHEQHRGETGEGLGLTALAPNEFQN